MRTQGNSPELYALVKPVNPKFIEKPPAGKYGQYVPHFIISQIIVATVGPFDWQLVEMLRGDVPEFTTKSGTTYPKLDNAIIGCVYRMTVNIDGETVVIEEIGSADQEAFENNDGERLKKAASDALKRCAMRLGVAIHLWCKRDDQYILRTLMDYYASVETGEVADTTEEVTTGIEDQESGE